MDGRPSLQRRQNPAYRPAQTCGRGVAGCTSPCQGGSAGSNPVARSIQQVRAGSRSDQPGSSCPAWPPLPAPADGQIARGDKPQAASGWWNGRHAWFRPMCSARNVRVQISPRTQKMWRRTTSLAVRGPEFGMLNRLRHREDSPSPAYGAALLTRLGRMCPRGSESRILRELAEWRSSRELPRRAVTRVQYNQEG